MKQTLNFQDSNGFTEGRAVLARSSSLGNWLSIRQVNQFGHISEIGLTFKDAYELRDFLNKNLTARNK